MRTVSGLLWGAFLFVCTCTMSIKRLFHKGGIQFKFTDEPDWSSLLTISDIKLHDSLYMTQKIGHFSGFFILSLILTNLGSRKMGIVWSIGYAVLTEILQLFFHRDGRIMDMFVDTAGILLAYAFSRWLRKRLAFRYDAALLSSLDRKGK